jgi:hypothetical protein
MHEDYQEAFRDLAQKKQARKVYFESINEDFQIIGITS